MAIPVATRERQQVEFDWGFAEAQFEEQPNYMRAPEEETYGRSLSTIRRLGRLMISRSPSEVIYSPEAAQAKVEFYTSVEEGYGTDKNLGSGLEVRAFDERPIINGKVMSKDLKTRISEMTESGLRCAIESARKDRRFIPQLTRSKWDHENALTVDSMARGETGYNTRLVISPFPDEGAAASGNKYWQNIGYVPHLRRGFVQLYHVTENGAVLTGSLSFDGSNKQRLREVFSQFGIEVPEGEITDSWLKYAITGNFSSNKAKEIATTLADRAGDPRYKKNANTVDVTKQYKPLMERVFNESYIHLCASLYQGRQTEGARKLIYQLAGQAGNFNKRYAQALYQMRANKDRFTDDDSVVLHELLVYSTIEMMRALHIKSMRRGRGYASESTYLQSVDSAQFQDMLSGYGADGAKNNRVYSACGLSINAGEDGGDSAEDGPQTAFGGNGSGAEQSGDKKMMNCPFCGAKVWGDPCARVLKCWDCNAMAKDGKVVHSGDGGHKARAERAATEAAEQAAQRRAVIAKKLAETATHESGEYAKAEPQQNQGAPAMVIDSAKPDVVGVS